uniref:RxLR effector protein n=1 Tax=Phytophthora sojae TaxID=67593 RepID=G1FRY1_PHYSO|nr:Avh188 [Phytophthora sojae]
MRLLLWIFLATLITLLSSVGADSTRVTNSATTDSEPAFALSATYNANKKKNLRLDEKEGDADVDDYGDGERGVSISTLKNHLGKLKTILTTKLYDGIGAGVMRIMYRLGETPSTIQAKIGGNSVFTVMYKTWYAAKTAKITS